MKKFILAIITFLYLGVSSGVAMEIHYCMGNRTGVEFYGSGDEKCSRCGMKEKKNGCCNDLHKFYKLNDSHKNTTNNLNFETGDVAIVTSYSLYNWLLTADAAGRAVQNHSPPDYIRPRACILNCVFRL